MESPIAAVFLGVVFAFFFEFFLLGLLRLFGVYVVVQEGTSVVYTLFGSVVAVLREPGIYFLWVKIWWRAPIIHFLGQKHTIDMRLDQRYLRSQAVNSEEGAPMGVGVWYEMFVNDPVAFLFRNADPRGSLAASVSNSTVRCLSNMPLKELMGSRHQMSQAVRDEVSRQSGEWGYSAGSVYVRKVHFRDREMIRQIESKVVNQLRQVTAAIKQDGENQVNIITSSAQQVSAAEFAKAAATRPKIVGDALREIAKDPEVSQALFEVLECQKLLESRAELVLLPKEGGVLAQLMGAGGTQMAAPSMSDGNGKKKDRDRPQHNA